MLSKLFLGMSLLGAEWVLYILLLVSLLSVTLIIERWGFYKALLLSSAQFRRDVQAAIAAGDDDKAVSLSQNRVKNLKWGTCDLDAAVTLALLTGKKSRGSFEAMNEIAQSAIVRTRVAWEKNLSILATIGANAPFIGLFGTVLGIIQAFHDLSKDTAGSGAQLVIGGVSDSLVATAFGIFVAIPAVVAYNLFQKRVKTACAEADALKSWIVAQRLSKD